MIELNSEQQRQIQECGWPPLLRNPNTGEDSVLVHRIEIKPGRLLIYFDRRAHNPILREANLDHDCPPIPWLGHRRVVYNYS